VRSLKYWENIEGWQITDKGVSNWRIGIPSVAQLLARLTREIAASLTGSDFILKALSVANIFSIGITTNH
jgi:hypothetical protein